MSIKEITFIEGSFTHLSKIFMGATNSTLTRITL